MHVTPQHHGTKRVKTKKHRFCFRSLEDIPFIPSIKTPLFKTNRLYFSLEIKNQNEIFVY